MAIMTVLYDGRAWVRDSFDSKMVVFFYFFLFMDVPLGYSGI
jgi:hypothetical protein